MSDKRQIEAGQVVAAIMRAAVRGDDDAIGLVVLAAEVLRADRQAQRRQAASRQGPAASR